MARRRVRRGNLHRAVAPVSPSLPPGVRRSVLLRSLFVQGSWNYRVMQGLGMAFAMVPVLTYLRRDREGLERALARHAEHFNAHPYFASVALGALSRLEADGADPETVRRFRAAIRGPLGALGDRLVWARGLPLASVVALILLWCGLPGWLAVATFLVLFNTLHIGLRVRGFSLGFDAGTSVGAELRGLGITRMTERMGGLLMGLVGVLAGVMLQKDLIGSGAGAGWVFAALAAVATGLAGGSRVWRPAAILTVAIVVLLLLFGLRAG